MAITNNAGVVVERLAYDPWGKRRQVNGSADTLDAITGQYIDRGFTMHEHIDEMGIINMNGRIYDPLIGRFMSADPYIQAPDDLQSHNRYAYVMNNPLNLTDPSGFSWISKAWKKAWKSPIFRAVLGIVVAVVAPALLTYFAPALFGAGALSTALATGALSGFASTGTLKGALTGAFTAGVMFGVGEIGKAFDLASGGIEKVALHAGAGCVTSVAGGGSCKTGALSGALGELGHHIPDGGSFALGTAKAAMLGGIGSKIGGGKFADGATTGAFGYVFNHGFHSEVFKPLRDFFDAGMRNLTSSIADATNTVRPDYVSTSTGSLSAQGGVAVNLRDGTAFGSGGVAMNDPRSNSFKPGGSLTMGWIPGSSNAAGVNDFLAGSGNQATLSIPTPLGVNAVAAITHSYGGLTAFEIGIAPKGKLSGSITPVNHATRIERN